MNNSTLPVYLCPKCSCRTSLSKCVQCGLEFTDAHVEAKRRVNYRQPWAGTVEPLYQERVFTVSSYCKCRSKEVRGENAKVHVGASGKSQIVCPFCSRCLFQCPYCRVFSSTTEDKPGPFDEMILTILEYCDSCGRVVL